MIEGRFSTPWPDEVARALVSFVQGSVVPSPPVLFWADPERPLHELARRAADDTTPLPPDGEEAVVHDEDRPVYGVITTQTCDIQDARRPKKPFVHIAPVVQAAPSWPASRIEQGRFTTYLHWIPGIPDTGLWVADLRLQVPVDKGWLVSRVGTVFDGFTNDLERVAFAEKVGEQASRRALADPVIEHIATPLRQALERLARDSGERDRVLDPVVELALRFRGSELSPDAVQLVALSMDPVSDPVKTWYREWWADHVAASNVGATLLEPDFQLLGVMTAAEYRQLVPLDWHHLSPDDE